MFRVLIAEDDCNLRKLIKKNLELRGFDVICCEDGKAALSVLETQTANIVVTDVMMPNVDGNELINRIKKDHKDLPVIMLTALDAITDKKKSFNEGADDYIVKPVDFDELELRIRAILRRYGKVAAQKTVMGNTTLDYMTKTMYVNGKIVETAKKEFLLLYVLLSSPGQIFSRTQLLDDVWGEDSESLERTVDVHVAKLREKLEDSDVKITAVRGLGYKVEKR